jgi:hypothetical protein
VETGNDAESREEAHWASNERGNSRTDKEPRGPRHLSVSVGLAVAPILTADERRWLDVLRKNIDPKVLKRIDLLADAE